MPLYWSAARVPAAQAFQPVRYYFFCDFRKNLFHQIRFPDFMASE
jgi:hypothetical protein